MTQITLTQKERTLLEDQKSHEEICIQKYKDYANQAQDPELKALFNYYADQEQQHFDTVSQMLNGTIPQMNQGKQQQNNQPQISQGQTGNPTDYKLCTDQLMTEKYVSSTYNTSIFEFTNSEARKVLNHIQKEEQEHGEGIFNYMQSRGMYNPK
ncbi:spore coat protein CotF [Orenia metallireducens]|uniref:Spore coat protein CotF n=1 Tax=Orenia metallireducens TaxID=1413210 RepID=A0A285I6Z6_9FIRM|nr:spore coat protein [Orenia metallireducens]PRX22482.1 spore coat protein CotF [Orenia metallireducens]SNY43714.1 Spore coat protein CotF [Orenia metallireducens]